LVEVEAGAEEFLPVRVGGASREKFGEVVAESCGDDEFGGAPGRFSGAQPGGEMTPDELGVDGRKAL